ncbi:MAG: beta-galactosidase [Comamonadaceae bacterium]|nr:beta-galactosidase [Comamonadaceae bacterium]
MLYLMGNQFAAPPANAGLDNRSYAVFSDQTVPKEHYFVNSINAWTLETDPTLEVNRIRFGSLQMVGRWYGVLPAALQAKIIGITLAGELHHFYPDFANGMGRYDNIKFTDYSPMTVRSFQNWLRSQRQSLAELNQQFGTSFASFDVIEPPARDIRRDNLDDFSQHLDAYAHGMLPIEGWLATLPVGHTISIYLDGKKLGEAEYGLSRQDVYESMPKLKAGVGFRYWLDFSALPRGIHTLQVVLSDGGKRVQIARRRIVLMGKSQESPPKFVAVKRLKRAMFPNQFWLDRPRDMQDYYFNPLAKSWSQFRCQQVTKAYHHWFNEAVKSGLPPEKLYSHQIAVAAVGSWNPLLTGSDESLTGSQPYKKGMNLYGAALNLNLLHRHYLAAGESFAVPEFHTQAWKDPQAPLQVLTSFDAAGATFMSPYFMTLLPAELREPGNPHDKFRVAPDNPVYGSNYLYQAIIHAASR